MKENRGLEGDIRIEAVCDPAEFMKLGDRWNDLLALSGSDNPYLTFEWLLSWWEAFGKGRDIVVLVARRGRDIVGLAPLMRHRFFIPGCRVAGVEFMGVPDADYHDFIILDQREDVIRRFLRFIFERARSSFLRLSEFPEDSPNFESLNQVLGGETTLRAAKHVKALCHYVPIDPHLPWEVQFRHVKRKMRSDIKRLLNRYKEIGGLELVRIEAEELAENLEHLYNHHIERLVHLRKQSTLESPAHQEFLRILGKRFSEKGWLELLRLDSNDDFVGIHYGFRYKGTSYCYLHGYNQGLSRYSPGKMVLYFVLREAHAKGFRYVDLLRGAESYKSHWTRLAKTNYEFTLFAKDALGLGFYLWFEGLKPALQRIALAGPLRKKWRDT